VSCPNSDRFAGKSIKQLAAEFNAAMIPLPAGAPTLQLDSGKYESKMGERTLIE
jgi:hypothetical protein